MPYTMLKKVLSANILYHYISCLAFYISCIGTRKLSLIWVFFCTLRPRNRTPPPEKAKGKIERRQIKLDLVIAHQGQCSHQVSLNLADLDFQGLARFLSQGLLSGTLTSSTQYQDATPLYLVFFYSKKTEIFRQIWAQKAASRIIDFVKTRLWRSGLLPSTTILTSTFATGSIRCCKFCTRSLC